MSTAIHSTFSMSWAFFKNVLRSSCLLKRREYVPCYLKTKEGIYQNEYNLPSPGSHLSVGVANPEQSYIYTIIVTGWFATCSVAVWSPGGSVESCCCGKHDNVMPLFSVFSDVVF